MAKRRKVGNLLALAVLATLVERPMHPYEIAYLLRERGKDESIKIQWGSLYTVVQNLEKHGFVEAAGTARQGRRPERTVYTITPAGRAELDDWLRELVGEPQPEFTAFEAALSVLGILPPDEVIDLLTKRADTIEAQLATRRAQLREVMKTVSRLFLVEIEYKFAIAQAEADWIRSLVTELVAGTMPDMHLWREFHAQLRKGETQ
jgi:DNA-binding PadR family transcriptional regulator